MTAFLASQSHLANLSEQSVFFSGDDDDIIQERTKKAVNWVQFKSLSRLSEAEEFGPSLFPLEEVHKIAVLDIRL